MGLHQNVPGISLCLLEGSDLIGDVVAFPLNEDHFAYFDRLDPTKFSGVQGNFDFRLPVGDHNVVCGLYVRRGVPDSGTISQRVVKGEGALTGRSDYHQMPTEFDRDYALRQKWGWELISAKEVSDYVDCVTDCSNSSGKVGGVQRGSVSPRGRLDLDDKAVWVDGRWVVECLGCDFSAGDGVVVN